MTLQISNLDSGDLGLSNFIIDLHELPLVVKIASKIMLQVSKLIQPNDENILTYAIQISMNNSLIINEVIDRLEKDLPTGIVFYNVDRRKIFELRGASGGITTSMICYLMVK